MALNGTVRSVATLSNVSALSAAAAVSGNGTVAKLLGASSPQDASGLNGRRSIMAQAGNPVGTEKFDYIIVGGGAAGCVLANRLTADGKKKVLVLEAGPSGEALEDRLLTGIPAGLSRLFKHPVLDWGLMSNTQRQLGAREVYIARGRALGGSTCTNATLYHRGTASDYDNWGLEGWKAADVLDWFVFAENFPQGSKPYRGTGGGMHVEQPRYQNPLHEEFFRAAAAVGVKPNPDFNLWDRSQEGYGEFQVTQKMAQRADMYRQHLKGAMARGNLKVLTGAQTTRVAIEQLGGKPVAQGVEFSTSGQFGQRHSAQLAEGGEVIMAAGAIHSPHILQLSGVGSAATLAEHGIKVAADLPGVGANLQDHPACVYSARTKESFDSLCATSEFYSKSNVLRISALYKYLASRTGPMATTLCDHGAFISTTGKGEPNLQMRFLPAFSLDPDGVSSVAKFGEAKKRGISWPGGITIQLLAVRAKSKGWVGIKSADPFNMPDININYFSDAEGADRAALRDGLRLSRKFAAAEPLKKYLADEAYPGKGRDDDASLDDFINKTAHSGNALVGTCRMGASPEDGSVVSSRDLKVFGVEGLRVVDSSVMPQLPGGQTGAPTVMIAERAAAMLRAGRGASLGSKPQASDRV